MPNSSIFDEFEKSWFLAIWSHHTTSIYWAETSFLANFAKFFGHQYTKNSLIFLKIKSCLVLVSRNNNLKLQIDWLANLDFIERKPQFRPFSLSFLATGRPKMARFSWELNQVWPSPLETTKLQMDWLTNFDFNERKPQFWQILLSFLATKRSNIARFSWKSNQLWPLPLETII